MKRKPGRLNASMADVIVGPYVGRPPDNSNTQPIDAIASTLDVRSSTTLGALIGTLLESPFPPSRPSPLGLVIILGDASFHVFVPRLSQNNKLGRVVLNTDTFSWLTRMFACLLLEERHGIVGTNADWR